MNELLHIARPQDLAVADTHYRPADLPPGGFVHCCDRDQLPGVLERWFAPGTELVLLHLDEALIDAPVVREVVIEGQAPFAHVYGPIPVRAILQHVAFTAPLAPAQSTR